MADLPSELFTEILTCFPELIGSLSSLSNLPMAMPDLPSDLFTEILSRLPVKSLLRFRSTSKSLKSLIDSHNFTNLHLKNSNNFNLILQHNSELYQLDFSNLTAATPLKYPFTSYKHLFPSCSPHILGSCNGLFCIFNGVIEIAIWNPNIRKHRTILRPLHPPSLFHMPLPIDILGSKSCVGFGYDPLADDYKLLAISCSLQLKNLDPFADDYKLHRISSSIDLKRSTFVSQVRLLSFKTNSWKVLPNMPYFVLYAQIGVFVENNLHWVVFRKLEKCDQPVLIVAFNLTQETFNEVPLPEILASDSEFDIDVSLLGECLCMTVNYQTMNHQTLNFQTMSYQTINYETTKVDVWVMKEYGLRDSWCKLFTLGESFFNTRLKNSLKPLGYSSNRSKVLLQLDCKRLIWCDPISDCTKLFWYDLKSEEVTCVPGIPNFNEAMIYVGSLLPPPLPTDNNSCRKETQHKLKYERKRKRSQPSTTSLA